MTNSTMSKISVIIRARQQNYTSLRATFRSENGAIDLASIMVGIIVIGLIGGVIAATVFAVIPWTQDNAAKQQLDSIHSAQNAFYGLSSDPTANLTGGVVNSFTGSQGLETAKLLTASTTYCAIPIAAGKDYTAYAKSASGKIWTASNSSKKATILSGTPDGACSTLGVSTGGTVTPAAANGGVVTTYSSANWAEARGLAITADQTVYASSEISHNLRKMTAGGTMVTLAGSGTMGFAEGQGTAAQFSSPNGIALGPDGNLYVADYGNHRIRMVTPTGLVTTVIGNGTASSTDGDKSIATVAFPLGVAFDSAGNMYISEASGNKIRKVTTAGVVSTLAALPSTIYALAVDATGNVYVGGNAGFTITKITSAGVVSAFATSTSNYRGLVVEQSTGIVYATQFGNHTIEKILPDGTKTILAGDSGFSGNVNGTGANARFANPFAITMNSTGALIVGSNGNVDTTLRMIK